MRHLSTPPETEGHLHGGPLRFRGSRKAVLLSSVLILAACAGGALPARETQPAAFSRPLDLYRELGFITGNGAFPAVARLLSLAGPADSSYVLFAMSLPANALRFQRDGDGFVAAYSVVVSFRTADSAVVRSFSAHESVRVSSFAETGRTDESVLFQHAVALPAGRYLVSVEAGDAHSARGFRAVDTLQVPDYRRVRVAAPIPVHDAHARTSRAALPSLVPSPRATAAYGAAPPRIYLEAYGTAADSIDVHLLGENGDTLWSRRHALEHGADALGAATVDIPADLLSVGRFRVSATTTEGRAETPLVVTISDEWLAAGFDDVLTLMSYIAHDAEIDSLRSGSPAERRAAWERFWNRRDPLTATPLNEYRDQFFQRVRHAADAFREGGTPGYATDRGMVYIVLGAPDQVVERLGGSADLFGRPAAVEWIYVSAPGGRIALLFQDRTGFGRLELAPASAATFRGIAQRLKSRTSR